MLPRRPVETSLPHEVPVGAEFYGGRHDGRVVADTMIHLPYDGIAPDGVRPFVRFLLVGGGDADVDTSRTVMWFKPTEGGTE